ncbi:MAG: class I SAM-dependent methyltransferase [Burkholderiales bacterium]
MAGPLLTAKVHQALRAAARADAPTMECSLDLDRSTTTVEAGAERWRWQGRLFPYLESCKERTVYHWIDGEFQPVARFTTSLVKLVPTEWGPPTFEIDGIKMLPTEHVSPYADAERKVGLVKPRGKVILDTCGGLGYFAACCLLGGAKKVLSYEMNADVLWLRGLNPWSPAAGDALTLTPGDIIEHIVALPGGSVDAILHDPPRFGIAGELYSQAFYGQLARVLKRQGLLFHYTGSPNKLTTGRDVPGEVASRLRRAGFVTKIDGDGVLATRIS